MSIQISSEPSKTFQYANRGLGRTAGLITELRNIIISLQELLHDFAKLTLDVAYVGLIIWAIRDLVGRLLLNH